ncbi:hypothetical protein SuNHUV7_30290 (plasmid) [Pseudoseohaeicola sp. NH-UV-7]|uniref:DUF533 domain-containing protein n=1 Tax=unclassified Sulfitobacter TaxID=196795 RepID=UPI000E0A9094|nr:DUF533 domain-containing protein [Sulfitobacter sp. JL08]AXI55188.1 DUF533 domain-containing protein [Sulfitobacter sp. JL08]
MSLVKTLAKVAIGVAVAKGASSMMKGASGRSASGGAGGLEDLLGGLTGAKTGGSGRAKSASAGGGIEDLLGSLLGGSAGAGAGAGLQGGLGGLLDQLGGAQAGGLQDMIGGGTGGTAGGSNTGGLLEGLAAALGGKPATNNADFGSVLNSQFDQTPQEEIEPSAAQEAAAGIMLAAMIQAAKSDGKLDDAERTKIIDRLGDDVSREEADFVQAQLQAPVDIEGLVRQTPRGMEAQTYAMSVLGIDLDSRSEAEYLHRLAQGYGMNAATVNSIHEKMGVPSLYE